MGGRQLRVASRSSARTPRRWPRSSRSASNLPALEARRSSIDAERRRRRRDPARRPARARPRPRRGRAASAPRGRHARRHRTRSSTPPAPPGRPRAACSRTATTARWSTCARSSGVLEEGDVVYLFLPLAHAYALLIQLLAIDLGGDDRLLRRRPEADRARADGGPPDLPAVGAADLREDLHARHLQRRPGADQGRGRRRPEGARAAGRRPGGPRRAAGALRRRPTRRCSRTSAASFGGRLKQANTGAAPIAQGDPRVLLRLRRAGDGGLRDDRDRHGRRRPRRSTTTGSARSARRCPAARSGSPTTARS